MRWDQPEPAEGAVHKQAGRRWRRRQLFKSDVGTKTKDANPIGDQYSCVSHQENREGRRLPGPSREVLLPVSPGEPRPSARDSSSASEHTQPQTPAFGSPHAAALCDVGATTDPGGGANWCPERS